MRLATTTLMVLLAASGLYASNASATCEIISNTNPELDTGLLRVNPVILADNDVDTGSSLHYADTGFGNSSPFLNCTQDHLVSTRSEVVDYDTPKPNENHIELRLADGTPSGIGVRFKFTDDDGFSSYVYYVRNSDVRLRKGDEVKWSSRMELEYFKLHDNIRYGALKPGRIARTVITTPGVIPAGHINTLRRVNVIGGSIVRPTCAIDGGSLDQTVEFGRHAVSDFANQAATAWFPFELKMGHCTDPVEMIADITFGVTDDQDPNNRSVFSMNRGGPGGLGIAIQARDDGRAMEPGVSQRFGVIPTNQTYNFEARLERTVGEVTPGEVDRRVRVLVTFR